MSIRELERIEAEIKENFPRLETSIGNLGDEVAIYIKYKAGSKADYDKFEDYFKGVKIVKDGLYNKIKR